VFTPSRDAPLAPGVDARKDARPRTAPKTPVRGWPSVEVIQLPPLSSPRDGPPQRLDRGPGGPAPRLSHTPLKWRTPATGHAAPPKRGRRLPAGAYPQTSVRRIVATGQSSTDLILTEARKASRISVHPSPLTRLGRWTTSRVGTVRRLFNRGEATGQVRI
jgi:hypothetical protein